MLVRILTFAGANRDVIDVHFGEVNMDDHIYVAYVF